MNITLQVRTSISLCRLQKVIMITRQINAFLVRSIELFESSIWIFSVKEASFNYSNCSWELISYPHHSFHSNLIMVVLAFRKNVSIVFIITEVMHISIGNFSYSSLKNYPSNLKQFSFSFSLSPALKKK